jgi:pilus assembly protein Flp/PilA
MLQLLVTLRAFVADRDNDKGATAVEYGLIVALIAAVIVAVVGFLGQDVLGGFTTVETAIDGVAGG